MAFIKEESEDVRIEETSRVNHEDTEEQTKMMFIKEENENIKIEETSRVNHEDTEEQAKMMFIKEENENIKIKNVFSMKQEDTETQTKMAFIKEESENMRIGDVFSITYEDTETQTKMAFIREENEDTKNEETVKHEDTETQRKMAFIREENEDTKNEETVKHEDTETQRKMAFIREENEDTKNEETVKHEDNETQTDCPLCKCAYSRLSQHLRLTHRVVNLQERKLLLAISSGRVDFRKGTCPVPTCGKSTSRMDRHLMGHTELTATARQETIQALKRRKILHNLSELRASNPVVPMASTLDQEDSRNHTLTLEEEDEEEQACDNPSCQKLRNEVADLNRQVDTLSQALRDMTRRYSLLRRKLRPTSSTQVTGRVLLSLQSPEKGAEEEEGEPHAGPSGEPADQGPYDQPPPPRKRRHLSKRRSTPSPTMCRL